MRCRPYVFGSLFLALTVVNALGAEPAGAGKARVYVGTYTNGKSQGIYLLELDRTTGALTSKGLAGESVNPSFLAIHPSHRYLYAVDEIDTFDGKKTGAVSAFAIDAASGKLSRLNRQSAGGTG